MDIITKEFECKSCSFAGTLNYDTEQLDEFLDPIEIDIIFCPNCGNELGLESEELSDDDEDDDFRVTIKDAENDGLGLDSEHFF